MQPFKKKALFGAATPLFLSLLTQNIIGVTDTAFLGHLGEIELGGAAMASLIYFCVYTLGHGLGTGTQIIVARRYGANRHGEIGTVLGQSVYMLMVSALVLVALSLIGGKAMFELLLSSPEVAKSSVEYWEWRVWGYLFAFGGVIFRAFYLGIGRTKVLTYNAIVMALVNIVLDYGLIFGHLGMPALGVKGAAIASVLAEASSLLFYFIYSRATLDTKAFGISLKAIKQVDFALMRTTFGLSVYLMMQALVSMWVWAIFFIFIEKLGERPLAIATIIRSFYIFMYIPIGAYGTVVSTTVSQLIGAGEADRINEYMSMVRRISLLTMVALTTIVGSMPRLLLQIFTDDPVLIDAAVPSLYVVSFALIICSVSNIYFSAVSATGASKMALIIELSTIGGYLLYSYIMAVLFKAPVHICYTVEVFYYIVIGVLSYRFINSGAWKLPRWSRRV